MKTFNILLLILVSLTGIAQNNFVIPNMTMLPQSPFNEIRIGNIYATDSHYLYGQKHTMPIGEYQNFQSNTAIELTNQHNRTQTDSYLFSASYSVETTNSGTVNTVSYHVQRFADDFTNLNQKLIATRTYTLGANCTYSFFGHLVGIDEVLYYGIEQNCGSDKSFTQYISIDNGDSWQEIDYHDEIARVWYLDNQFYILSNDVIYTASTPTLTDITEVVDIPNVVANPQIGVYLPSLQVENDTLIGYFPNGYAGFLSNGADDWVIDSTKRFSKIKSYNEDVYVVCQDSIFKVNHWQNDWVYIYSKELHPKLNISNFSTMTPISDDRLIVGISPIGVYEWREETGELKRLYNEEWNSGPYELNPVGDSLFAQYMTVSTDLGDTWNKRYEDYLIDVCNYYIAKTSEKYFMLTTYDDGKKLWTSDDNLSWTEMDVSAFNIGYGFVQSIDDKILIRNSVGHYVSSDHGATWEVLDFSGFDFSVFDFNTIFNDEEIITYDWYINANDTELIHFSDDYGQSWSVIPMPDVVFPEYMSYTLFNTIDYLIMCTSKGDVFATDNMGEVWHKISGVNPLNLVKVFPQEYLPERNMLIATYEYDPTFVNHTYQTYVSFDLGQEWKGIDFFENQSEHYILEDIFEFKDQLFLRMDDDSLGRKNYRTGNLDDLFEPYYTELPELIDISVNENPFSDFDINISPNPFQQQLQITISNQSFNAAKVIIRNTQGVKLHQVNSTNSTINLAPKIEVSGLYLVEIWLDGYLVGVKKAIKI